MNDTLLDPHADKVAEAAAFMHGFSSVILGTVSRSGHPLTSYAPYILDAGNFYIFVSALARHSRTLQNGRASLLFIEEEQQARNIFARRRLVIECHANQIVPEAQNHDILLGRMGDVHGETVKLLRTLPDFTLFNLSPEKATFVTGFGAAWDLSAELPALTTS